MGRNQVLAPRLSRARQRAAGALHTRLSRLPLRSRLALAVFGLLAVLLAGLGVLHSIAEERVLLHDRASALYDEARLAAPGGLERGGVLIGLGKQPLPAGVAPPNFAPVAALVAQRLTGPDTSAAVLDASGALVAEGDMNIPGYAPVAPDAATVRRTLTQLVQTSAYALGDDADGQRQLYILLPIISRGSTVGLLELATRTAQIDRSVATTRLILLAGIGAALLLAGVLALPLIGAALRPLRQMERASRRIAGGALSLRLQEPETDDEIGRLAHSFNVMVAQLEEAFARQKRFVSDVSHELRTPLTALGGGLEMLLLGADAGDPEAQRRLLRGMYAETERMRRLVEDLLTLARLDEGRLPLRLATLDAGPLLRDVAEQAERLARGQIIVLNVPATALTVYADGDRLRQVLLNLVDNALKFTPPEGSVTLAAAADRSAKGDRVTIEVRDTGTGIAPEALPHVFDRFYRADFARARAVQPGGSGLGLAIARSLVEAQGGAIGISSAPSQGTTVSITLPAARSSTAASPAADPSPASSSLASQETATALPDPARGAL
jgi:two-component system, OmpR family, sensor kinase